MINIAVFLIVDGYFIFSYILMSYDKLNSIKGAFRLIWRHVTAAVVSAGCVDSCPQTFTWTHLSSPGCCRRSLPTRWPASLWLFLWKNVVFGLKSWNSTCRSGFQVSRAVGLPPVYLLTPSASARLRQLSLEFAMPCIKKDLAACRVPPSRAIPPPPPPVTTSQGSSVPLRAEDTTEFT